MRVTDIDAVMDAIVRLSAGGEHAGRANLPDCVCGHPWGHHAVNDSYYKGGWELGLCQSAMLAEFPDKPCQCKKYEPDL